MPTANSCMAPSTAFLIALDGQTGKEVWVVKHAWPEHGETITPAPLIADDKVLEGFGGDEFAARGRMTAYNLKDGSVAWDLPKHGFRRGRVPDGRHQQGPS